MSALQLSRDRLEDAKRELDQASGLLMAGDVRGALERCDRVFLSLRDCYPTFANDWRALDMLLGQIVLVDAYCKRHRITPPERLRTLAQCAVETRLEWLEGEPA
jgi:hypothetical protein